MLYIRRGDFFAFRKEFRVMMEYQNNNGNYDKRNRRKNQKRKLLFYRAACAMLGLLIVSVIFGTSIQRKYKDRQGLFISGRRPE